jgi:ArsR family transcriptional regulator, arsenate/arsenite/antimonite-responsive transcriptional repressor
LTPNAKKKKSELLIQLIFFANLLKKEYMGASKTHQFTAKQRSFAAVAKALGHPARIAIVQHLMTCGYASNKHLAELTDLSEATVHQHLMELFRAGLISDRFAGKFHFYMIHHGTVRQVEELKKIFE